jgi:hypothetical protein
LKGGNSLFERSGNREDCSGVARDQWYLTGQQFAAQEQCRRHGYRGLQKRGLSGFHFPE